jgi:uncharacterized protein (DUF433 family)
MDGMQTITRDLETMSGISVCFELHMPGQTLFEYLKDGNMIAGFLEGFPTVSRELALETPEQAKQPLGGH